MQIAGRLLILIDGGHAVAVAQAADLLGCQPHAAKRALQTLARIGLVRPECGVYHISADGKSFVAEGGVIKSGPRGANGKPREVSASARIKAWRAIRIKQKFGLEDLARAVLDGSEQALDPLNNINKYVIGLHKTGYVVEMVRRVHGKKRWMLVRDTGRHAPVLRNNGDVWDPNEQTLYRKPLLQEADHELA